MIDKTEGEIEIEKLNSLDCKNEVPTMPDTQALMTPQLLSSPQTHISSRQYQQLETTKTNCCSCWE